MSIRRHVYVSSNFSSLFGVGVDVESSSKRIHPDDYFFMLLNAIAALRFIDVHRASMRSYKFIIEYRIRSVSGSWVRVIEQQSLLESDSRCNAWLALSVLYLSPDQSPCKVIKSGIIDLRSNHFLTLHDYYGTSAPILSTRELEILSMVKSGLLSKEISSRLYISVHTVNTHRQNILRKLSAVNLHEAITYASSLGLLS
jgi:DNA-binding CsgD family transcriptional regulator